MVVTETWLETRNGRAVVLDAAAARRQNGRKYKKRKGNHTHQLSKKRKRNDLNSNGSGETTGHNDVDEEGDDAEDENLQLFADAQSQLQREMEAAGFAIDQLPMSFGSAPPAKKRKRQRVDVAKSEPEPSKTSVEQDVAVAKVHVTFDSDGEVAAKSVESVVMPTQPQNQQLPTVIDDNSNSQSISEADDTSTTAGGSDDVPDVDPAVFKFWKQRRTLFRKYDEGIQLDKESWYSVTPETIAEYLAQRCACDVLVDPFSGCGGNIIQFAKTCKQVIAIEIDAEKIRMAKHNAQIYGVADKIEWIHGDALEVLPTLQADVVFLSPPWGGMNYNRQHFAIDEMMIGESTSGVDLFEMARRVAKNVVYYLPKTTPESALQSLAPDEPVECERLYLTGQLKVVNAYYGDLAFQPKSTKAHGDGQEPADNVDQTLD